MGKLTEPDEQVRAALDNLLRWDEIARSGQLAKFLSYIVEAKIRGEGDAIKAYSIAVDVFGRPATFDPQSDPIVRVQARRLRALLEEYYNQSDDRGPVRINLPVGRYVPEFIFATPDVPLTESAVPHGEDGSPTGARMLVPEPRGIGLGSIRVKPLGWMLAALVIAVATSAALLWQLTMSKPNEEITANGPGAPRVSVLEFQNLTGDASPQTLVGGLALELVTDLELFEDIEVSYGQSAAEAGSNPAQAGVVNPWDFVLSGIARIDDQRVQYGVILKRAGSDSVVWNQAVTVPLASTANRDWIDTVSRSIALMLGSHRGPLDADARTWLRTQTDIAAIADPYVCRLLFHMYRDSNDDEEARRAQVCIDTIKGAATVSGQTLAIEASLLVDATIKARLAGPMRAQSFLTAEAKINEAVFKAPTSSFVWEQKGHLQEAQGMTAAARADYTSALQLNPANDDALAALGRMMALTPDWGAGADAALTAVSGTPEPPAWYYVAPALNSLRARQFAASIRYAETVASVDQELGPIIAVVAGTEVGNSAVVNRYLPQILEQPQFRIGGIMTQIAQRVTDPALLGLIRVNLVKARVPEAALDAPF